ncbi:MAG: LolA family protein [Longimicrobiales bacterium]
MMNKKLVTPIALGLALAVALLVRSELSRNSKDEALTDSSTAGPPAAAVPPATSPAVPAQPAPVVTETATVPAARRDSAPPSTPANPPATATAEVQSSDAATALKQAAAAYAAIRSMRAEFVQSNENPLLGKRTTSRGTFAQRQPDRFLMRFSQPAGDVIVGDGEYFWIYYPSVDAKQVLRTRAAAAGGMDLQAQFVGDPTRRFQFTDHGVTNVAGRSTRVITLVPREAAGYRSLKVWLDQRDHLVRRFELTNENGVVQLFDLSNLEINPTLPNDLFRFTPPANALIIER